MVWLLGPVFDGLVSDLVAQVAARYTVAPETATGLVDGVTFHTFIYGFDGTPEYTAMVEKTFRLLQNDVLCAWTPGTQVMWRKLPEMTTSEVPERVYLRLRIGSAEPCLIKSVPEGAPAPIVSV